MTGLTFNGRLPGVAVDVTLPEREPAVRLDVTGFVGFAERGPLHLPVAIEDPNLYRTVFGDDLVLAEADGRPVVAQLGPAVRAFFDNGGRRCHVVRVAGPAATPTVWQLPGLRIVDADGNWSDILVEAAWAGAWSVGLQLTTSISRVALQHGPSYTKVEGGAPGRLTMPAAAAALVAEGDLLELNLGSLLPRLFVRVGDRRRSANEVALDTLAEVAWAPGEDPEFEQARLAGVPAHTSLEGVRLLRFDLSAHRAAAGETTVFERQIDLGLTTWPDRLQPPGPSAPDLTRSLVLRAEASTVNLLRAGAAVVPDASAQAVQWWKGSDDLDAFEPEASFLDPHLADTTVSSFAGRLESLTSLAAAPVPLRGLHALAAVEEIGLVCCPDLVQRGWKPAPAAEPEPAPTPPSPPAPTDWSDFHCCPDTATAAPDPEPPTPVPPAPVPALPQLIPPAEYQPGPALAVQRSLVTMCAALTDRVAILSMPEHLDLNAALGWQRELVETPSLAAGSGVVPLSYAGLWHPWVRFSAQSSTPPDGLIAGMVAARERSRGVWVAPAAVALRGPVALAGPPFTEPDSVRLFDAHVNLIRQGPRGFATVSAHTLADAAWLQLSVRRTISWLRKLVLRIGRRYVFEVANDRFVSMVASRFDLLLAQLTRAGAFHAARVEVAGPSPDPAADAQLVVNLHVAPSSPIEFITITLVRTGDGLLDLGVQS